MRRLACETCVFPVSVCFNLKLSFPKAESMVHGPEYKAWNFWCLLPVLGRRT